jgi:hypothetical protein
MVNPDIVIDSSNWMGRFNSGITTNHERQLNDETKTHAKTRPETAEAVAAKTRKKEG